MIFCLRERLALLFSGENIYIYYPPEMAAAGGGDRQWVGVVGRSRKGK